MTNDNTARRERIAAQVFAVMAANHNDVSYHDHARAAFWAADALLKVSEEWYGSTEPDAASPSLLEAAKSLLALRFDYRTAPQEMVAAWNALREAIAREEARRG